MDAADIAFWYRQVTTRRADADPDRGSDPDADRCAV